MTKSALIIDDNPLNLDTLSVLLQREGLEAVGVTRLNDALPALNSTEDVAVVFLDLEFPNGYGMDFIPQLLNEPRLQNVPIIAYSVHISELTEARDAGFDGFIGKPLQPSRFPQQLQRILDGEAVWEVGQ